MSLSHLLFGAGCGIGLYWFLIIAFLSTLSNISELTAGSIIVGDNFNEVLNPISNRFSEASRMPKKSRWKGISQVATD